MKIRVAGQAYTGFTSLKVSRHFLQASGEFEFIASPLSLINNPYPLQVGQSVQITVADQIFLNGYIEEIDVSTTSNSVDIRVSGRDKTADVIDSTINATVFTEYVGSVSFKSICETVVSKLGITDIGVTDEVGVVFAQGDYIAPTTGEKAFDFLERYARKGQVLLVTDGLGNLLITRGGTQKLSTQLLLQIDRENNNILTSRVQLNNRDRYNKYQTYTQYFNLIGSINAEAASLNDAITNSKGDAFDTEIRSSRQLVFIPDAPLVARDCINRATWEANYRKAKGFIYSCSVSGHTYDGVFIWPLNTQIQVIDEFCNINAFLLLDTVTFSESVHSGLTTSLQLVPSNSYTLTIEGDYRRAQAEDRSNAFYRSG